MRERREVWERSVTYRSLTALALGVVGMAAMPAAAQNLQTDLPSSLRRMEEDIYGTAVELIRQGHREDLLNLINGRAGIAHRVLLRFLEGGKLEEAKILGKLFPLSSVSNLESRLVDFYLQSSPQVRVELLRQMEALTDAQGALARLSVDDLFNRELWAVALEELKKVASAFESLGFSIGQARCLRDTANWQYRREKIPLEVSVATLKKALTIYEEIRDARGQVQCLLFLGRRREAAGEGKKAREFYSQALLRAETSHDFLLQVETTRQLAEASRSKQLEIRELSQQTQDSLLDLWPKLEEQEGLRSFKYRILLRLASQDPKYLETFQLWLAEETDQFVKMRGHWNLFWHYRGLRRPQKAIEELDRTIDLAQVLGYGPLPTEAHFPAAATMLLWRGDTNAWMGNLEEAAEDYQQALLRLDEHTEPSDAIFVQRQRARILRQSAHLWQGLGDYSLAIHDAEQALEIAQRMENHRLSGWALETVARIHGEVGDLDRAEAYLKEAAQEPDLDLNWSPEINLAKLHLDFGRYEEALRDIEVSEEKYRTSGLKAGQLPLWATRRWQLLTEIWLTLGDVEKALEAALEAEKVEKERGYISGKSFLGPVLIEVGRYQEAEKHFQRRLLDARAQPFPGKEADALRNLGRIHWEQGRLDEAKEYLSKALEIFQQVGRRVEELEVLLELGRLFQEMKNTRGAGAHFQNALILAQNLNQAPGIWSAHHGLGSLAASAGSKEQAIEHLRVAAETVDSVAGHIKVKVFKTSFLQNKLSIYNELISLLSEAEPAEAFWYAEKRRARAFLEWVQRSGTSFSTELPEGLAHEKRELEMQLTGKQRALLRESAKPTAKQRPELIAAMTTDLQRIRTRHSEILSRIQLSHPKEAFRQGVLEPLKLRQVQQEVLRPGQVLVEYVISEKTSLAFVLTENTCQAIRLPVQHGTLIEQVRKLLSPFEDLRTGRVDLLHIGYDLSLAHKIYQQIFEPLEPHIEGARELIILPDDVLYYLPFESLVRSSGKGTTTPTVRYSEYRDVDWLLRHYTIRQAVSATSLHPRLRRKPAGPERLVAFANPLVESFEGGDVGRRVLRAFEPDQALPWLPPLPHSVAEARRVTQAMSGRIRTKVLLGKEATESAFAREAPSAAYLHFASHSLLNERRPLYSGLVLVPDGTEDGLLQGFEIAETSLNSRLVTLSACQTALGRLLKGEGLVGLTRPFLRAGADSVLVSLWSIEDSTADFMEGFYRNLLREKMSPAEALQEAKLSYLKKRLLLGGEQELSLSHPFFWAPFMLISKGN